MKKLIKKMKGKEFSVMIPFTGIYKYFKDRGRKPTTPKDAVDQAIAEYEKRIHGSDN